MENAKKRRNSLPVLHVSGTHYEIGYDTGRTFRHIIKSFVETSARLRLFLRQYDTHAGRKLYDTTYENVYQKYPYYINEMRGLADGSDVPFHKLFLLQMDDIIETVNGDDSHYTGGCSDIAINEPDQLILGHTEDAFAEVLNHIYIVKAHIVPSPEDILKGAREERFASLCYAGHLPGYTMGYNNHGLVFTINTLSPQRLAYGKTPRTFITRAILAAKSVKEVEDIIRDKYTGTANGFSLNLTSIKELSLFNFEVAPNFDKVDESLVNVNPYPDNKDFLIHCNKYQRLFLPEVGGLIIASSDARIKTLKGHPTPRTKRDVKEMLSDTTDPKFRVFQDIDDAEVKTVAAGIFDLKERTWSVYLDKPNSSDPIAVIPIDVEEFRFE